MFNVRPKRLIPGLYIEPPPANEVPGFRMNPDGSVRDTHRGAPSDSFGFGMPLGMLTRRYADAAQALVPPILEVPTPSPELLTQSALPIGLAGFRARPGDNVPGFKLRLEDAMPGFNLIENESGVQRQEMTWSDGTRPESRPPAWLYKLLTMPVPQLSTAFDPQTGRRIVPYAPLINAGGTYPGENEHMTGSTRAYVDETSAPPDLSSVSAPSAEEWPSTDADEWPSPDAEEWPSSDTEEWPSSDAIKWPSSDTEVQSQAPSTAPARAPSPQQAVQQATWEAQLPRLTNSQLHSEGGGNKKFEDPRSAPMARLPSGIAAPSVRPIADNNFILANARDDAMRQHASANVGSPFGQESVYGIGPNNAIRRGDIPASTGIRNSVIASFSFPAAPANAAYQSYGTTSAHPTPFEYRGPPFDVKVGNTYSPHNLPQHLAGLSGVDTQGTTTAGPSISDAYPEPLIPGAQYAQVIQQNNAILRNPRIDRATERLLSILTETVESLGAGSGPIFGIQAHFEFAKRVRALNIPGIRTAGVEQSFDLGAVVRYGLDGSVRTDIVLRDRSGIPIAIYDLKTGNAKLTPSRVQELRNAVGRQDIPVIELRYVTESAILR